MSENNFKVGNKVYVIIPNKILGYDIKTGLITESKKSKKYIIVNFKDSGVFQTHRKYCFNNYEECMNGLLLFINNLITTKVYILQSEIIQLKHKINHSINNLINTEKNI